MPFLLHSFLMFGAGGGAPVVTDYANLGGTGNRGPTGNNSIAITTGGPTVGFTNLGGTNNLYDLIDGTQVDEVWFANNDTDKWIQFDFGSAKVIDELKWYQSSVQSHGTWKFQGSNTAGSGYVDLATFTLGSSATQTITTAPNTTAYRYYRLQESPGSTSNSPFIREVEFKIGP